MSTIKKPLKDINIIQYINSIAIDNQNQDRNAVI